MADNCVNRSAKEFKDLARQSVVKPIVLAAKVGLWQDKNNTTEFPKDVAEIQELGSLFPADDKGQLEIDFESADLNGANKKVMKKARSLAMGEELTNDDIMEAKRADSDYIENVLLRGKIGAFKKEYNKAGVLTAIAISPSMVRGRGSKNAYAIAQNYARILNNKMPNTKGVANIAEVERAGNSARINIRLPRQIGIIRSYFPINRNANFLRVTRKLFTQEALKNLFDNGQITKEQFVKIYEARGLDRIELTDQEMRDIAQRDINDNFTSVTINGEVITEPGEYINEVDEEMDEMPIEGNQDTSGDRDYTSPVDIKGYVARRKSQIETLEAQKKKIVDRSETYKDRSKYNAQIGQIEELLEELENDLKELDENKGKDDVEKLEEGFKTEYRMLDNILANPTPNGIEMAKQIIEFLGFHENRTTRQQEGSVIGSEEGITDKDLDNIIERVSDKKRRYQEKLVKISKQRFVEVLEDTSENYTKEQGITEEEMFEDMLKEMASDTDVLSKLFHPLGRDFTVDDKLGRYIKYFHDVEVAKSNQESSKRVQRINDLTPKIKPILKKLGKTTLQQFTNITSSGDQQLVTKYNNKWREFLADVTYLNKNKRFDATIAGDKKKISKLMNEKHDKINKTSEKFDFRYLPEIHEGLYTDFLQKEFGQYKVDEEYANKLKKRLGEAEYENLIQKQLNFLFDFERKVKKDTKQFLDSKGVDNYDDLTKEDKDTYNEFVLKRNNPKTIFKENNAKKYSYKYKGKNRDAWILMDYNIFYPKTDQQQFYDDKFKTIEESRELLDYWKEMRKSLSVIHQNHSGSDREIPTSRSIPFQEKALTEEWWDASNPFKSIFTLNHGYLKEVYRSFKDALSTKLEAYFGKGSPVRVAGANPMFKTEAKEMHGTDIDAVKKIVGHSYLEQAFNYNDLKSRQKKEILNTLGVESEKDFIDVLRHNDIDDLTKINYKDLMAFSQAKLYRMQQSDMSVVVKGMLGMSANYQARENTKNFVHNVVDVVLDAKSKNGESILQNNLKLKKDFFVKAVVDSFRNTSGEVSKEKIEELKKGTATRDINKLIKYRNYTPEEKRLAKIYKTEIERNERILNQMDSTNDKDTYNKLKNEIDKRKQKLNLMGQVYNVKSVSEAVTNKFRLVTAMGFDPVTAMANHYQAKGQAYMQQGYKDINGELVGDYTEEQINKAYFFMGSAMHNNAVTKNTKSKKRKKEIEKMYLIVEKLGAIQDGTDYMQKAERTNPGTKPTLNPLKKEGRRLLMFQHFTEYYNQVPLVLARLMNYEMPDGSSFFDGETFPHHDIVDGRLKLKESSVEKFEKDGIPREQLKSRYEDFDDSSAISFIVDLTNNVIPSRNGDYTTSGTALAKENTFSRIVTMFSTWVAGISQSAYGANNVNMATGKEQGGYMNNAFLSDEGRTLYAAISGQNVVSSIFMSPLQNLFSSVPFFWLAAVSVPLLLNAGKIGIINYKTRKGRKNPTKEEKEQINQAYWTQQSMKLLVNNMSMGTITIMANKLAGMINSIAGTSLNMKDKFDYTFGGQLDKKTALAIRQSSKQQSLLTFISALSSILYMIMSELGWDDEVEETASAYLEYQEEQDSFYSKLGDGVRNFSANFMNRQFADNSITTNPQNLFYSVFKDPVSAAVFATGLTDSQSSLIAGGIMGDETYGGRNMYQGMNKLEVVGRQILPKPFRNIGMPEYALGFEINAQKVYESPLLYDMFMFSDLKKERKEIGRERKSFKQEFRNRYDYKSSPVRRKNSIDKRLRLIMKARPELNYPDRNDEFDADQHRIVDLDRPDNDESISVGSKGDLDYKDENGNPVFSPEEKEQLTRDYIDMINNGKTVEDFFNEE